jgi:hypothetical protein
LQTIRIDNLAGQWVAALIIKNGAATLSCRWQKIEDLARLSAAAFTIAYRKL